MKIARRCLVVALLIILAAQGIGGFRGSSARISRAAALAPADQTGSATATPIVTATSMLGATASPTPTSTVAAAAAISVAPISGAPGSLVGVTGTGFTPNATIVVAIGGVPAFSDAGTSIVTNGAGSFAVVIVMPQSAIPGPTILSASDGFHAAGVAFLVLAPAAATISLSQSSGAAGSSVVVSGNGFTPNATIGIAIGGIAASTSNGAATVSDANGSFVAVIIVPATVPAGATTVSASDGVHAATAPFTVTQGATGTGLTASPSSGEAGTAVALAAPAGSFPPGVAASISFQGAGALATLVATGVTNSDGSLSQTITIPPQAPAGTATVSVVAGGVTRSTPFTVVAQITATQTTLTVAPASAQAGAEVQASGSGFTANSLISIQIGGQPATTASGSAIVGDAQGSFSATIVVPVGATGGTQAVTASDGTHTATAPLLVTAANTPTFLPTAPPLGTATPLPTAPPVATATPPSGSTGAQASTPTPTATPVPIPGTTTYFAEGDTGRASTNGIATFTETLNLLNPGPISAPVSITYYIQGSSLSLTVQRTVGPTSVLREQVNRDVGPDKVVAAAVRAPADVVVTRTITRVAASGQRLDGSTAAGVRQAGARWYFAEGYTGGTFQEYLAVLNTSRAPARVTVRLAPQARSAAGARTRTIVVPALSRGTVDIYALNKGSHAPSVGMLVTSDRPIVAERVEYFGDGSGSGKFGSIVTAGISAPATHLRIPYGRSGGVSGAGRATEPSGDQAYITVLNPALAGAPVQVTALFNDQNGHHLAATTLLVAAGTRQTISANTLLGRAAGPYSVSLDASGPVVAEEAQYFGGSPNVGAHPGVAAPASGGGGYTVYLANLDTALADSTPVQQQLFLYNPGSAPLQVIGTYFDAAGGTEFGTYTVPAGGIATASVNHDTGDLAGALRGVELTVAGNSGDVIAYAVGRTTDGRVALADVGS